MKIEPTGIRLAATDLSNHLSCPHLTSLDLGVARGEAVEPPWRAPDLIVLQELGLRHESAYLASLQAEGRSFADLRAANNNDAFAATVAEMRKGTEVIAQGVLTSGRWHGRPDVLLQVPRPSTLGPWSYEAYDCKLARETKAATILQLCAYSSLLAEVQGVEPEFMYVVAPGRAFKPDPYRFAEYAAYFRLIKGRLEEFVGATPLPTTYPEPCAHCDICRWFRECDQRRRDDDHLSLVAGISRLQRNQLVDWDVPTVARLAAMPIPLQRKPAHGARETYERSREQARVQVRGRQENRPVHEPRPIVPEQGLCRLPEPSPFDIFLDFESDPFAEGGELQYLFGFTTKDANNQPVYEKRWCLNPAEEKQAFEWLVDFIMARWAQAPGMHVYHFGAHESGALKSMMGRYAAREDQVDRMLRAHLLVDLHTILKQSVRASVEEYSLKKLEPFHNFTRNTPLDASRAAMRLIEHNLQLGRSGEPIPGDIRATLEGYNREDCLSTESLRDWLESLRARSVADGKVIPRPPLEPGDPSEEVDEHQQQIAAIVARLTDGIPAGPADRSDEQSARWLLAQLLDFHRREAKAAWWEGYRLADLEDDQLLDERAGLSGLQFLGNVRVERNIPVDRYSFPVQEAEARAEDKLYLRGETFGTIEAIDPVARTLDVKKTRKTAGIHPTALYVWDRPYDTKKHANALLAVGNWVADNETEGSGPYRAARDLLLRLPPRLPEGHTPSPMSGEDALASAIRVGCALDSSIFAIQGPPGAGKTFTGARMICALNKLGKRIGITALSYKVMEKLMDEAVDAARYDPDVRLRCMERSDDREGTEDVVMARDYDEPLAALRSGQANVVAGTSWLWTRPEYFEAVDVLFIDEAGQMALADVIAVAQAAKSIVLIGDPQQLERPLQGSHPPGAEKSALQHLLGENKTIAPSVGLLLPETYRMHPNLCAFTSELFYEQRLGAQDVTRRRFLGGHPWLNQPGLWFVPVEHEGNQNSSRQEVEAVDSILASLLRPGVLWTDGTADPRRLRLDDVLIVAPYNAQVFDLLEHLPQDAKVGTVDRFQGQQAAVVIASLTTSSPADAPHGMEFLYSLHRLNVATSRAFFAAIVVGSPRLFEPECHSPRQMQLANAFCRFREMAAVHNLT